MLVTGMCRKLVCLLTNVFYNYFKIIAFVKQCDFQYTRNYNFFIPYFCVVFFFKTVNFLPVIELVKNDDIQLSIIVYRTYKFFIFLRINFFFYSISIHRYIIYKAFFILGTIFLSIITFLKGVFSKTYPTIKIVLIKILNIKT